MLGFRLTPPVDIRALHKSSRPVSQPFSAPARDGRAFTRYSGPPTNLRSAVTRDGSAPARNEFQFLFFSAAVSQHTVALICRSRPLDKVHSAATQDSFHKYFPAQRLYNSEWHAIGVRDLSTKFLDPSHKTRVTEYLSPEVTHEVISWERFRSALPMRSGSP